MNALPKQVMRDIEDLRERLEKLRSEFKEGVVEAKAGGYIYGWCDGYKEEIREVMQEMARKEHSSKFACRMAARCSLVEK